MSEQYRENELSPADCVNCTLGIGMLFTPHGCKDNKAHVWANGNTACDQGETCQYCTKPVKEVHARTWYRVVDYMGPESNWFARLALMIRGDGPLVIIDGKVLTFDTLHQVAEWGKDNARYIIGLEPRRD